MENERIINTNEVELLGKIVTEFTFSHSVLGEKFYSARVAAARLSGYIDDIPLIVSEKLIDINENYRDKHVHITGSFRSYNKHIDETTNRLLLFVFAKSIKIVDKESIIDGINNTITLEGYICKPTTYRQVSLDGNVISDVMIAVNNGYRSSYIPCICWSNNALFASYLNIGTHIKVTGRIQSRDYIKKFSDTEMEQRTAYEVSVYEIEVLD